MILYKYVQINTEKIIEFAKDIKKKGKLVYQWPTEDEKK